MNFNDRLDHVLSGLAGRLERNEVGLVNHGRKCMPGAEALPGGSHARKIANLGAQSGKAARRPTRLWLPAIYSPGRLADLHAALEEGTIANTDALCNHISDQ